MAQEGIGPTIDVARPVERNNADFIASIRAAASTFFEVIAQKHADLTTFLEDARADFLGINDPDEALGAFYSVALEARKSREEIEAKLKEADILE